MMDNIVAWFNELRIFPGAQFEACYITLTEKASFVCYGIKEEISLFSVLFSQQIILCSEFLKSMKLVSVCKQRELILNVSLPIGQS